MKQLLQAFLFKLTFCCSFTAAFSQNYDYKAPIPPTPEAASLAKFSQVPVSYSTGLPNISIPLYEIQLKDLSLPISLNYHAGGVRVDEIASTIGLGWSLSAGGSVSSTVFGKPDFEPNGYATDNPSGFFPIDRALNPYVGLLPYPETAATEMTADYDLISTLLGMTSWTTQNPNAAFDTQPDLFYYNLGGRSGKFFHTREGQAHTVPFEPLLIKGIPNNPGMSITDEKGIVYEFSDVETSITSYSTFGTKPGPQTEGAYTPSTHVYYLSTIKTPSGDSIWFEYDIVRYNYKNQVAYTRYLPNPGQTCDVLSDTRTESLTDVIEGKRLKAIKSSLGHEVFFHYASCDRADLPGTFALKEVEIKSKGSQRRKLFRLTHDYFYAEGSSGSISDDCNSTAIQPEDVRLKLLSVQEEGKPAYTINYNESSKLPSRLSQAQDHWGFYNGTTSLLPKDITWGFRSGGSREPVRELMGAWTISKLTYPTGGYTEFDFEPHDSFYSRRITTDTAKFVRFYNSDYTPSTSTVPYVFEFEVGDSIAAGGVRAQYLVSDAALHSQDYVRASIIGISVNYSKYFSKQSIAGGEQLQLNPGKYKLVIEAQGTFDEAYVMLDWNEIKHLEVLGNHMTGGLRVKKITDYSGDNMPMVREFVYRTLADSTLSSGKVSGLPEYVSQTAVWTGMLADLAAPNYHKFCNYTVQSSRSTTPLSTLSGSSVVYTAVGVLSGTGDQKSFSTYRYSFEEDYTPHAGPPFTPATSMEWARGLLLEETDYVYKSASKVFQPIRRKTNSYTRYYTPPNRASESGNYYYPDGINEAHALGLQIVVTSPAYVNHIGACQYCVQSATYVIESFKLVSVWQFLNKTEERLFDNGDTTRYVATTTHYYYDNARHAMLSRQKSSLSDGRIMTKSLRYPLDFSNATGTDSAEKAIQEMISKHILSPVVEQQEWLHVQADSLFLSGVLIKYKGVFPEKVLTSENSVPLTAIKKTVIEGNGVDYDTNLYKERSSYTYLESGTLAEVRKADGMTVSYLWGYSNTYPIAEIQNATYVQVKAALGGEVAVEALASSVSPSQNQLDQLNGLRQLLPQSIVTTYTYDPLVGVRSVTDPNGKTTFYDYDGFGRLKLVKDHEHNILKTYEYNYKE